MHKRAVELELNMMAVLQYDFEFEFPFPYVKQYFSILKKKAACQDDASVSQAGPHLAPETVQ